MIGGKTIGGVKLAPKLSPNKTVSGLIAGVSAAAANVIILDISTGEKVSSMLSLSLSGLWFGAVIVAFLAQASDLFVSYFKRKHAIKDSGCIIPGHGGMLDRFDGMILTAPVLLVILLFLRI
jgi:phosphatidate cytidylyltransferase